MEGTSIAAFRHVYCMVDTMIRASISLPQALVILAYDRNMTSAVSDRLPCLIQSIIFAIGISQL